MTPKPGTVFSPEHARQLELAVEQLEWPGFAARLADYAGQPILAVIRYMPGRLSRPMQEALRKAIFKCLELAVGTIDEEDEPAPAVWTSKLIAGLTGGIGGFIGPAALAIELPITTTFMLRSIAEIARAEGEDLKRLDSLLACLEVFALGSRSPSGGMDIDYFALRAVLAKLTSDVATSIAERGALSASTPIVARLVGEIVGRFGLVISDLAASRAVPIVGALGGATVNMIFMDHFQKAAHGHFTIRRLERFYGPAPVAEAYREKARFIALRRRRSPLKDRAAGR